MKMVNIFAIVAFIGTTHAQLQTGSIVVIGFTEDKIIIAADSLTLDSLSKQPTHKDYCKIAAINNQLIFGSVGSSSYAGGRVVSPWSNAEEVKAAFLGNHSDVFAVAKTWGEAIASHWNVMYSFYPRIVERSLTEDGIITAALFVMNVNNRFSYVIDVVRFDGHRFKEEQGFFGTTCLPYCAIGKAVAFNEFNVGLTERAKREGRVSPSPQLSTQIDIQTLQAIRLADLAAAYEPTKDIGGAIDAVEFRKDGTIHWIARKPNCRENEE